MSDLNNFEDSSPIHQYDLDNTEENNINVSLCYASLMTNFFSAINYHTHNNIELMYLQSGKCTLLFSSGEQYTLQSGDIFIINKNRSHCEQKKSANEIIIYYLGILENTHNEQKIINFLNAEKSPLIKVSHSKLILSLITKLFFEAKTTPPYFRQNTACLLTSLLLSLARLNNGIASENPKTSVHIKNIINYIELNYYKNCTLDTVAVNLHLSKYYVSHLFKTQMSITLTDYIINKRLTEAKKLLRSGNFSISKISKLIGYSDPLYFSRLFKDRIGIAPQDYRTLNRKDYNIHSQNILS